MLHTKAVVRYCAGLPQPVQPDLNRWARIAIRSGNPVTIYKAKNHAILAFRKEFHPPKFQIPKFFFMNAAKHAAQAGLAIAWAQLNWAYEHGTNGIPIDPTRAFASLYTEYMLTKSPALAYQIWQSSQDEFNPEEIERGEKLAHRAYRDIRQGKKPHIPLLKRSMHP